MRFSCPNPWSSALVRTAYCSLFVPSCQVISQAVFAEVEDFRGSAAGGRLFDVQRLGAGRLALRIERDFFHAGFGLAQQILAAAFERLAALVDGDRFLE